MHLSGNQDGVHLAGLCKNGIIRRLKASPKSPNDDFIALNADDIFTRQEASNLVGGPIENIVIDGLDAKECHSFVRINSLTAHVNNISINDLRGACRAFVINMDNAYGDLHKGFNFLIFNNRWDTNFKMWFEEDISLSYTTVLKADYPAPQGREIPVYDGPGG
ncbi:hypothetical protein FACS1894141_2100 [Spirochaetia bacterium]|nr:hypothetical protein FACS1894141_2100 [Spirochaetia bacterium]